MKGGERETAWREPLWSKWSVGEAGRERWSTNTYGDENMELKICVLYILSNELEEIVGVEVRLGFSVVGVCSSACDFSDERYWKGGSVASGGNWDI